MTTPFTASQDMPPEDFEKFAEHTKRAYLHNRAVLNERRRQIQALEYMNRDSLHRINLLKIDMLHHGIEVPE